MFLEFVYVFFTIPEISLPVHIIRSRVDMWWVFVLSGALILVHLLLREVGHLLEGVDRDEHRSDVGLKRVDF